LLCSGNRPLTCTMPLIGLQMNVLQSLHPKIFQATVQDQAQP
jgi:hypothetical protein